PLTAEDAEVFAEARRDFSSAPSAKTSVSSAVRSITAFKDVHVPPSRAPRDSLLQLLRFHPSSTLHRASRRVHRLSSPARQKAGPNKQGRKSHLASGWNVVV